MKPKLKSLMPKLQKGTYLLEINEFGGASTIQLSTNEQKKIITNILGRSDGE